MTTPQLPKHCTASDNLVQAPQLDVSSGQQSVLQFQLMFTAGDDRLRANHYTQLMTLANLLDHHAHLEVRLEGYADPRGSEDYNHVLSDQRALSVQHTLETLGVAPVRIRRLALGFSQSQAPKGDIAAYALERRVDVHLVAPTSMTQNS